MTKITGNTYPVREQLRALGGQWDAAEKCWVVSDDNAEKARALVATAPREQRAYRPTRCLQCGARSGPRGWPRIYRNGVCSDCYAERDD